MREMQDLPHLGFLVENGAATIARTGDFDQIRT